MNTQELSKSESAVLGLKLTVMTLDIDPGSKPVTQVFYKEELTLGRLPSNDVVLGRPEISGIHARLRIEKGKDGDPDRLFITDLGSSNGTSVEKSQLRPRIEIAMMPNERIFIGNYVIKPSIIGPNLSEESKGSEIKAADLKGADTDTVAPEQTYDQTSTISFKRNLLSDAVKEFESRFSAPEKSFSPDDTEPLTESESRPNDSYMDPSSLVTDAVSESDDADKEDQSKGFKPVSIDDGFNDRKKTKEFISPFGTPFTKEEEDLREAREISGEDTTAQTTFIPESESYPARTILKDSASNGNGFPHGDDTPKEAGLQDQQVFTNKTPAPQTGSAEESLSVKITVDGADVQSINFIACAYIDLKGLIEHKGNPLGGVLIDGGELGTTISQPDGTFTFSKILEGSKYTLVFSKDRFSFTPSELDGTVSLNAPALSVTATQLFSISGVITHQGVPLAGVEVNGGELGTVYTKEDGSYIFENVPEGKEYQLSLRKEGYLFKS
jgi:pSer/pThr/pTyr-binding forkhead associated (FHA) protein